MPDQVTFNFHVFFYEEILQHSDKGGHVKQGLRITVGYDLHIELVI